MQKTLFVSSAMIASIAMGVEIREQIDATFDDQLLDSLKLSQLYETTSRAIPFYQKYAQTQEDDKRSCTLTFDRLWNTTDDYESIRDGDEMFTDVNFPTDDAVYWPDFKEHDKLSNILEN